MVAMIPPPTAKSLRVVVLFLALGFLATPLSAKTPPGFTFHSLLTRDLANLAPDTRFSLNDRIHLYTVWTGLKGSHQLVVKWVRPDGQVQETTRFTFSVPEKAPNYRTWAWLEFKKSLMNIPESKFLGKWKARMFLDSKQMAEYEFQVL